MSQLFHPSTNVVAKVSIAAIVLIAGGGIVYSVALFIMQRSLVLEVVGLALTRFRPTATHST